MELKKDLQEMTSEILLKSRTGALTNDDLMKCFAEFANKKNNIENSSDLTIDELINNFQN